MGKIQKVLSLASLGLTGTNLCNALYAYNSGPYGQRKGFLDANTNSSVVFGSGFFGFGAAAAWVARAFTSTSVERRRF